jgi:hypothetical protein
MASHVIEHAYDPQAFVAGSARFVARGVMAVLTPNFASWDISCSETTGIAWIPRGICACLHSSHYRACSQVPACSRTSGRERARSR